MSIHKAPITRSGFPQPTLAYSDCMRMNYETYTKLPSQFSPFIEKKDTSMKKSISPHECLSSSLRFLTKQQTVIWSVQQ